METDLIDERQKKKVNYDVTLESIKATTQEQIIDQKVAYEEKLLVSREECHKYRVHIGGLEERIIILKDQLQSFRERIVELEKESVQ